MKFSKSSKIKISIVSVILISILGFIYYYVALPAINIHAVGFWYFIISMAVILGIISAFVSLRKTFGKHSNINVDLSILKPAMKSKRTVGIFSVAVVVLLVFIVGSFLSSPFFSAKKYQELIDVTDRDFTEDIKPVSFNQIPILDKDSAILLGSRKMGNMVEYVSQFEVSDDYTQINYNGTPVRVSPLKYGGLIKWFTNNADGIPAYMMIDMANQNVECVKLKQEIKYSESEHFGRNIHRYLRFNYPTYIFDKINFEIDDNGVPYWICPVKDYTIGLFGGETISNVVVVNASTGELKDYGINSVPDWVDRVFSAELLISYYDYYGTLKHGYWNSVFGQKDCLQTTDGYNYLVIDEDIWVYTGVTSVGQDKSNVGFVLMNQRTAETRYYNIPGAEEYSAMNSAEGQVQHLGYIATFPLLLNIANEPTYFIALKDEAGLVKKYAMVNIAKYSIVATGDSVTDCQKSYINLLKTNNVTITDVNSMPTITGVISKISQAVVEGNSHYYIMLTESDQIFDVSVADYINIIKYDVGSSIKMSYSEGENYNTVLGIE